MNLLDEPTPARDNIVLAAILARADGRIEITDAELLEVNLSARLHIWRDASRHVSIIELESDGVCRLCRALAGHPVHGKGARVPFIVLPEGGGGETVTAWQHQFLRGG